MPDGRETCFAIFVEEVFEFAVEEFVRFLYRDIYVAIRKINLAVLEKLWGILFAPLGVGIRIGGDGGFEPMLSGRSLHLYCGVCRRMSPLRRRKA
jgi:hypothetical protein